MWNSVVKNSILNVFFLNVECHFGGSIFDIQNYHKNIENYSHQTQNKANDIERSVNIKESQLQANCQQNILECQQKHSEKACPPIINLQKCNYAIFAVFFRHQVYDESKYRVQQIDKNRKLNVDQK